MFRCTFEVVHNLESVIKASASVRSCDSLSLGSFAADPEAKCIVHVKMAYLLRQTSEMNASKASQLQQRPEGPIGKPSRCFDARTGI